MRHPSAATQIYAMLYWFVMASLWLPLVPGFFAPGGAQTNRHSSSCSKYDATTSSTTSVVLLLASSNDNNNNGVTTTASKNTAAQPRIGPLQTLLDMALASPLWTYVLVPQARQTMVKTAQANGIEWTKTLDWIKSQPGPWNNNNENESADDQEDDIITTTTTTIPKYYNKPFHAYETGNLSWEAALEVEIASRAVGARNFPSYGKDGEDAFRDSFQVGLEEIGATVLDKSVVVDLGCGTGMSTRRLAKQWPGAQQIIGFDLSPYYVAVGKRLLQLAPKGAKEGGPWVTTIERDDRIDLRVADAANTGLADNSVDVVNLMFVLHELPLEAAQDVIEEALRILKPNKQLWICEMDFGSPAYAAQRANPLLFSLIRATEPYLDEYADYFDDLLHDHLVSKFKSVKLTAATGRHYSLVATKGGGNFLNDDKEQQQGKGILEDLRFNPDGTYRIEDTHLKVWESSNQ